MVDFVPSRPFVVRLDDLRGARVRDGHHFVKCLWGVGVELLLVVNGPHVVDVVVGRLRPDVTQVVNSWQPHLDRDSVPSAELSHGNSIVALAHARPALPLR